MSDEILVNVMPRETRVAVVENGVLQEVHFERAARRGYVGNIYKGRVQRVMPGMQAAFVEIGLDRAAFLHANDISRPARSVLPGNGEDSNGAAAASLGSDEPRPEAAIEAIPPPSITELLHEGQDLIVQVIKDPIGSKGARLSMQLSIPSRFLVLLPQSEVLGVSARIEDPAERLRLKALIAEPVGDSGFGVIVRTNAEGVDGEPLSDDLEYLTRAWRAVRDAMPGARVGDCVYEDLSLPLRALRDMMRAGVEKVRVDSSEVHARMLAFAGQFMPDWVDRIEYYPGDHATFELYGIDDEIGRALERQVPLKSGGYLVFDQTEAMTTVDVNTGGFLGHRNLEETAFRTNLEAAQATARQLRLRNLGGIIIIDFIDMQDAEHQRQVLRQLEKSLARDHAKTDVHDFSPLGLVEMTRKRTTESLERQLCEPCPACSGRGTVRTSETLSYEIFRDILRAVRQFEAEKLLVLAAPAVVTRILEDESAMVAELEATLAKSIRFQPDAQYLPDQYDVVLL